MKKLIKAAGAMLAIMMCATSLTNAQYWSLTGNSGTTPGTNYVGTNDNQPLIFKTNGTASTNERMRISGGGNVGIGVTTPNSKLHINSSDTNSLAGKGIFTIGLTTGKNMVFDKSEIQARNNGASALIYVNRYGGNISIGNDATATSTQTPLIYANSSTGNVGIGSTASSDNRLFVNGSATSSGAVLRCKVNYVHAVGTFNELYAIRGQANSDFAGVGVLGEGDYIGVKGVGYKANATASNVKIGVYGEATGTGTNWAGYFVNNSYAKKLAIGVDNFPTAFGVGGTGTALDNTLAVYGDTWIQGRVVLGSVDPASGYKLSVDGKVICEELRVQTSTLWPDYVFDPNYKLATLDEVEQQIKINKHLPGVPSACEVEESGIMIGEMQSKLMLKIEELTLYVIDLKKENKQLRGEMNLLKGSK